MAIWKNLNKNIGNCLCGDTFVSVFDTETNEYKEIKLKDLYKNI